MRASGASWIRRCAAVTWLVVVWVLLWGGPDLLVVGSGVAIAAAAVAAARMPRRPVSTRVRWRRLPGLAVRFLVDLFRSSADVALTTFRRGPSARASVLALRLPPGTGDGALLLACNRISLEPGTIVLDVERHRDRIHVYQLGTEDSRSAEAARDEIQRLLDATLAAFPTPGAPTKDPDPPAGGRT